VSRREPTNLAASVRRRLLNWSRDHSEDFLTLTRYAIERLLYRLSQSQYADRFVLKGALLLALWTRRLYRPTRDLDLLGYGESSQGALTSAFRELCSMNVEADGLVFDPHSVRVTEIREEEEYGGQRVQMVAMLGNARIALRVDVGFGDVVTPAAREVEYPTLLELPAPRLRAYPQETVIAEKLQAMVALGMTNSRMKDFYDVWMMSRELTFDGRVLARAIRRTFECRQTALPCATPVALTSAFALQPEKGVQWKAFLSRNGLEADSAEFARIVADLHGFLMPPLAAVVSGQGYDGTWHAGGPWVKTGASCF